jgi:hypothetical protein
LIGLQEGDGEFKLKIQLKYSLFKELSVGAATTGFDYRSSSHHQVASNFLHNKIKYSEKLKGIIAAKNPNEII